MDELKNIKISGSASISGGSFNKISISGSGKIDGECSAQELSIAGAGKILGNCNIKIVNISGAGKIEGDLEGDDLRISGSGKILGNISFKNIKTSGSLNSEKNVTCDTFKTSGISKIQGKLKAKDIKVSGILEANNVESDNFTSSGMLKITEMLNAEKINITLFKDSEVGEIGGKDIKIVIGYNNDITNFLNNFRVSKKTIELKSKFVEGDTIYLENVKINEVSGQDIEIGENCIIHKATYTNSIKIADSAKVEISEKT